LFYEFIFLFALTYQFFQVTNHHVFLLK
jgi:hypothetical protein